MENPFEIINERLNRIEYMLNDLAKINYSRSEKEIANDEIFTIEKVAKYLNLSVPTIYGYVHRRQIPHYKLGKRLYFKKAEILELIDKKKIKTTEEIEAEVNNYLIKRRKR
jgi:excisionase family DNA binding protein